MSVAFWPLPLSVSLSRRGTPSTGMTETIVVGDLVGGCATLIVTQYHGSSNQITRTHQDHATTSARSAPPHRHASRVVTRPVPSCRERGATCGNRCAIAARSDLSDTRTERVTVDKIVQHQQPYLVTLETRVPWRNGWGWLRTGFTKDTSCTVWVAPQDGFQYHVSRLMTQTGQWTKLFHVQPPEGAVVTYREPTDHRTH